MTFEEYARQARRAPAVVLNGLDNIPGRHQVQRATWPDVIVDGAIGDFTCQVSRHPWPDDIACLMCLFREPSGAAGRGSSNAGHRAYHWKACRGRTIPVARVGCGTCTGRKTEFLRVPPGPSHLLRHPGRNRFEDLG